MYLESYLFQRHQRGPGGGVEWGGLAQEVISVGIKHLTCEADRSTRLVPSLKIRAAVSHFPCMFSCPAQG